MDNARKMSGETYPSKIMVFTPQKNMAMLKSPFLIEYASSNGPFSIVMLVSGGCLTLMGKSLYFREIGVGKYIRMLCSSIQNLGYLVNVPEYTTQL